MKTSIAAFTVAALMSSVASAECVLKQYTTTDQQGKIESVQNVRKDSVPWNDNKRKCIVTFEAKVNGNWHSGVGSYVFSNNESEGKSCAIAFNTGKKILLEELYPQKLESNDVLVCTDGEDAKPKTGLEGLTPINRPEFAYEGKRCGWFYETVQEGDSLYQYTVIACEMRPDRWNIMDRF